MDVETVEEWTARCRLPQPSSRSSRTVGTSHALPLAEVHTARTPFIKGIAGCALANLFRALNPWDHESGLAVPS
jgi:hypothetical protein